MYQRTTHRVLSAILPAVVLALAPVCARGDNAAEEFVGPFVSWADLKRDYQASGDGIADDTDTIQRALDDLRRSAEIGTRTVLYVPAGTYRLTRGLTMTSHMYAALIGEDPARTVFRWDGPDAGVMLTCNGVRYSQFGRITWDGRGKALAAVSHRWDGKTPNANSGCEHVDEVFKDVGNGIRAGIPHFMDAECTVRRCRFQNCSQAGLSLNSMNALDWWVWQCRFEGCRVGATNCPDGEYGGGHFHIYESQFLVSTEADILIGHANYFGIRNNVSLGSRAFFVAKRPTFGRGKWADDDTWGGQIKLQGNRILDPADAAPIRVANCGPLVLLDNVIRGRPWASGAAVEVHAPGSPDVLAVGNTFTVEKPFDVSGRLHELDTRTATRATLAYDMPPPAETPPHRDRKIFEVSMRSGAAGIQSAVFAAGSAIGQRPVVHLGPGVYAIDRPLVLPANSDVQLIGDGQRTSLRWTGRGAGPVIRVCGPSQATLSNFAIWGGTSLRPTPGIAPPIGVVVDGCDQEGARIRADQVWARGAEFGVQVHPLRYATVQLTNSYPRSSSPQGVMLSAEGSRVSLFGGAMSGPGRCFSVNGGGSLLVRDTWYEGPSPRLFQLTGSGAFTLDGASLSCETKGTLTEAPLVVDGFRGPVTLLGVKFANKTWLSVRGSDPDTEVLLAGSLYTARDVDELPGKARLMLLNNRSFVSKPKPGSAPAAEKDADDAPLLRALLAQDREGQPATTADAKPGATNVRLHRVSIENVLAGGLMVIGDSAAR